METAKIYHGGSGKGRNRYSTPTIDADEKVKVAVGDTTPGYLASKLVAGANIVLNILNPGGNEQLQIVGTDKPLYTMTFSNVGVIGVAGYVPAPSNGVWAGNGQGYGLGAAATLKAVWLCVNRFKTTNGASTINFAIRKVTADGSQATALPAGSSFVREFQVAGFPDSSGSFRYYFAFSLTGISDNANAGEMIYCNCTAKNIDTVEGVTVLAFWELQ